MQQIDEKPLKSEGIGRELQRRIFRQYAIGESLPSEKEMAEEFGVAVHTVREAILPLVRSRVLARRRGSGITVQDWSRTLPTAIFTRHDLFSNPMQQPFLLTCAGAVRDACLKAGLFPHIFCGAGPIDSPTNGLGFRDFVRLASEGRLAAVIHLAGYTDPEWLEQVNDVGIPMVSPSQSNVEFDYSDMIFKSVGHLRAQGARRIAFIYGERRRDRSDAWEKLFLDAVGMMGLSTRPEWIQGGEPPWHRGTGKHHFKRIWNASEERPDGLVINDDRLFQDLAPAMASGGIRVPDELKIVTHANDSYPLYAGFPYTACTFGIKRYAEIQVEILLGMIRKEPVHRQRMLIAGDMISVSPEPLLS